MAVIPAQNQREEKSLQKEFFSAIDARNVARLIRRRAYALKGLSLRDKMASKFYRVKCKDCNNQQIIFSKASITVNCQICGSVLAQPTGGKAKIKGEVIEELSYAS